DGNLQALLVVGRIPLQRNSSIFISCYLMDCYCTPARSGTGTGDAPVGEEPADDCHIVHLVVWILRLDTPLFLALDSLFYVPHRRLTDYPTSIFWVAQRHTDS